MNFATFDIESRNWNEFQIAGLYTPEKYIEFFDMVDFIKYIQDRKITIYAHNGGKYDYLFVLDACYKLGIRPDRILLVNGSIIKMQIGKAEFRDSLAIMPGSLAKILPFFGTEKLDMNYNEIGINKKTRTYLKQDCKGLYIALDKYFTYLDKNFEIKKPGVTIASTAMKTYRKKFNCIPNWEKQQNEDKIRKCYLGGRCEIFKMSGENIKCFDINSMYPAVMRAEKYPYGKNILRTNGPFHVTESERKGFIHAKVECPDLYLPILPIRLDGKMLFLNGIVTGYWTLDEYRMALDYGYKTHKIYWTIEYPKAKYLFWEYVEKIYNLRKSSSNEAEKYILKILLNSLYGKFGQRRDKEEIIFDSPDSDIDITGLTPISLTRGIYKKLKAVDSSHILPQIAAHVTSYARMLLYKYLDTGSYYCDTDSVFTKTDIENTENLGGMKLEADIKRAEFYFPKLYRYTTRENKLIHKAKGFGKISNPPVFDRIINKESITEEKLLSFKQCLISNKPFTAKRRLDKRIRAGYNKRVVLHNGDTIPHTLRTFIIATENRSEK